MILILKPWVSTAYTQTQFLAVYPSAAIQHSRSTHPCSIVGVESSVTWKTGWCGATPSEQPKSATRGSAEPPTDLVFPYRYCAIRIQTLSCGSLSDSISLITLIGKYRVGIRSRLVSLEDSVAKGGVWVYLVAQNQTVSEMAKRHIMICIDA